MVNMTRNLKFGYVISLLFDGISLALWLGFIATKFSSLNIWLMIVSLFHITYISWIHYLLKKYPVNYFVPKEYRWFLGIVTALSTVLVITMVYVHQENALPLGLMLLNSILFLFYPVQRYIGDSLLKES